MMTESVVLSISADIASIASVAITIGVALQVRSIKKSMLVRSRIPEAIRDLEKTAEELRVTLKVWPTLELESRAVLQRIDGILANFLPKLTGAERKKLTEPHLLIKRRSSIRNRLFPPSEAERKNAIWNVYDSLMGGIEALRQRGKDDKKRI